MRAEEVKAVYKTAYKKSKLTTIVDSKDTYNYLHGVYDMETVDYCESLYILLLNRANKILGWQLIGVGGTTGVTVDIKKVLVGGLITNASAIILTHNHPSGNINPSGADNLLTRKIAEACKSVDLVLIDHIIYTTESYYSYKDNGGVE